jgi:hypothetical protein
MPAPMKPYASAKDRLIIRGSDAGAFIFAGLLAVGGLLVINSNRHAWTALALVVIDGVAVFLLMGWYQRSKTIAVFPDHLLLTAWLEQRHIPLEKLDALSLRSTLVGRSLHQTIVCWGQAGQELGEIPIAPFGKEQVAQLLSVVQSDHPSVTLDRELQHFLQTA